VLGFTPRPSFKAVDSILKSGQDKLLLHNEQKSDVDDISLHGFIRGENYYGGNDNDE
jgi:hypothetical protein